MMSTGDQVKSSWEAKQQFTKRPLLALYQCTWTLPLQLHSCLAAYKEALLAASVTWTPTICRRGGLTTVCQTEQSHPMQIEGPYIQTVTSSLVIIGMALRRNAKRWQPCSTE
jgi:hypothetical protein